MGYSRLAFALISIFFSQQLCVAEVHLPAHDAPLVPWTEVVKPVIQQLLPATAVSVAEDKIDTLVLSSETELALTPAVAANSQTLEFAIIPDRRPSAFALPAIRPDSQRREQHSPARICVSTGLLELLNSESELAFVIAHELAHLRNDHFSPDLPFAMFTPKQLEHIAAVQQNWEFKADADALNLVQARGFQPAAAREILSRLEHFDRSATVDHRRHPAVSERVAKLANVTDKLSR